VAIIIKMRKIIAFFVAVFSVFMFAFLLVEFYVIFPIGYVFEIKKYSNEYDVNPALVASLICVESRFNSSAKSSKGASGLMQLMPTTFQWVAGEMGEENDEQKIFDADTNIKYGCYYLSYLFEKYKNEIYVLSCYNAGEGTVSLWGQSENFSIEHIQFAETRNYVQRIENLKRFYASRLQ